jgi:hypothetical protein
MMLRRRIFELALGTVISAPWICLAQTAGPVGPAAIGAGKPLWVASYGDKSVTDAWVDIGTLRQVGAELEVSIRWPYLPASYGPEPAELDRVGCNRDEAISYSITNGYVGADGKYHPTESLDPATEKKKAEAYDAEFAQSGTFTSYGNDPRSMACWAAARKCAGQKFTWPPPPNNTPLEDTPQAIAMNEAYNKAFVPGCTIR